ncbi:unnamed protein product [Closterium sp. NIES-54]
MPVRPTPSFRVPWPCPSPSSPSSPTTTPSPSPRCSNPSTTITSTPTASAVIRRRPSCPARGASTDSSAASSSVGSFAPARAPPHAHTVEPRVET